MEEARGALHRMDVQQEGELFVAETALSAHLRGCEIRDAEREAEAARDVRSATLGILLRTPVDVHSREGGVAFSRAPVELVRAIVRRLGADGIGVSTVKLEGSAAAHIINPAAVPSHTDLDFTFALAPTTTRAQLLRIRGRLAEVLAAVHSPQRRPDEVLRAATSTSFWTMSRASTLLAAGPPHPHTPPHAPCAVLYAVRPR